MQFRSPSQHTIFHHDIKRFLLDKRSVVADDVFVVKAPQHEHLHQHLPRVGDEELHTSTNTIIRWIAYAKHKTMHIDKI